MEALNEEVEKEYERRRQRDAPSEAEIEAKASTSAFYAILDQDRAKGTPDKTAIDAAAFCELMSEEAQAQTVQYAKASSAIAREWSCESAVELLVTRSKRFGASEWVRSARVIGVNARGDKATATVRFGDGPVTSVPLVREDGEWKLAATPAG